MTIRISLDKRLASLEAQGPAARPDLSAVPDNELSRAMALQESIRRATPADSRKLSRHVLAECPAIAQAIHESRD